MKRTLCIIMLTGLVAGQAVPARTASANQRMPNFVLIMCDDMGYSDLGCYGGEIETPHIDALAREGIRFSNFKNAGRCCPSRAALMTGRYQHAVGMGWMTAVDEHRPGYRGQLTEAVPTVAEILKQSGYATYLSGKWHLTIDSNHKNSDEDPNGSWPVQRGFDESYGGLSGGGGYYKVHGLVRNLERITDVPKDYYYTTAITEHAVSFIRQHDTSKPLFLYLAHYAPHRPLQAPDDRVEACRARYEAGYDVLREKRFDRLKRMGLIESAKSEPPVHQQAYKGKRPEWNDLSKKMQEKWITEMATYAAMVEMVDEGIGEVVEALKRKGLYENTVIFFLSDNGATKEGGEISQLAADLSNTPFRSYKQFMYQGGISSPLIVHCKRFSSQFNGVIRHDLAHIMDLLPTCLDLAGVDYPESFRGEPIQPPDGISLLPYLQGETPGSRTLCFEHQTSAAVISGEWKLVFGDGSDPWELINLDADPFEQKDLSGRYPEMVQRLEAEWNQWAEQNQVLPRVNMGWGERIKHFRK